jgi:3-hydroxyacyl-CoA dehydrogenase/enoyl-CoA hydratase/3-hydroxybutyryl-CoA epimerase
MGPLRLIDEIGVDITVDIAETLAKAYNRRDQAPEILRHMREANMLGRKTGSGFYKYEGKQQTPNESLEQWRQKSMLQITGEAINIQLILLMINEAARCIEEQVVEKPEDVDYGMILGVGFPPCRGGPLRFAENYGLKNIWTGLDKLRDFVDRKFTPCELLKKHAHDRTTFYENR